MMGEKYFVTLDEIGRVSGRYVGSLHGNTVPPTALQVSREDFEASVQRTDVFWQISATGGLEVAPPDLESARAAALSRINAAFDLAAAALVAGYPEAERLTWPVQQAEALAWGADNEAPTPYLDELAVARGVSFQGMREVTLAAVQLFLSASPALVGKRQRLATAIREAEDTAALDAIQWGD